METIITGLVNGIVVPLTSFIAWAAESGVLFAVFLLLWIAFGVALVWNQGGLDAAWAWIRSLPLLIQVLAWFLFLPVMAGLWIWETSWPLILRFVLVGGLAFWNLLVFLPRAAAVAQ
jgi:hypothetical protein